MAAVTIESNIWTFRTRAGTYRVGMGEDDGFENSAEKQLVESIKEIKTTVLEGAEVKNTAFFSRAVSQNRHGQHSPTNPVFGITGGGHGTGRKKVVAASAEHAGIMSYMLPHIKEKGGRRHSETRVVAAESVSKIEDLHRSKSFKKFVGQHGGRPIPPATDGGNATKSGRVGKVVAGSNMDTEVKLHHIVEWMRRSAAEMEHEVIDSHFEPLQPEAYIRHRIDKFIAFYKERIPQCSRTRNICQLLLITGTLSSSVLAFFTLAQWAAVVAIFVSSVTAFLEFSGTNAKLGRYSFTVHALQELIVWYVSYFLAVMLIILFCDPLTSFLLYLYPCIDQGGTLCPPLTDPSSPTLTA